MKMLIIATRDIVSNVFGQPVFVPHLGQAIRSFGDECRRKEPGNVLAQHPEDFELWLLGTYNDADGSFEDQNERKQIAVGANYRETAEKAHGAKGEIVEANFRELQAQVRQLQEDKRKLIEDNTRLTEEASDN